jgi:hypothetical protein
VDFCLPPRIFVLPLVWPLLAAVGVFRDPRELLVGIPSPLGQATLRQ